MNTIVAIIGIFISLQCSFAQEQVQVNGNNITVNPQKNEEKKEESNSGSGPVYNFNFYNNAPINQQGDQSKKAENVHLNNTQPSAQATSQAKEYFKNEYSNGIVLGLFSHSIDFKSTQVTNFDSFTGLNFGYDFYLTKNFYITPQILLGSAEAGEDFLEFDDNGYRYDGTTVGAQLDIGWTTHIAGHWHLNFGGLIYHFSKRLKEEASSYQYDNSGGSGTYDITATGVALFIGPALAFGNWMLNLNIGVGTASVDVVEDRDNGVINVATVDTDSLGFYSSNNSGTYSDKGSGDSTSFSLFMSWNI